MSNKNVSNKKNDRNRPFRQHGARFKARRRAVDILFEAEFRDVDPVEIITERRAASTDPESGIAPIREYTATVVQGVAENLDAIDTTISTRLASAWSLHRIPAVDRAILRVATWEMIFAPDVPPKVALTEAIELASQYSTHKAPGYINGILDEISRESAPLRSAAARGVLEEFLALAVEAQEERAQEDGDLDADIAAYFDDVTELPEDSELVADVAADAPAEEQSQEELASEEEASSEEVKVSDEPVVEADEPVSAAPAVSDSEDTNPPLQQETLFDF